MLKKLRLKWLIYTMSKSLFFIIVFVSYSFPLLAEDRWSVSATEWAQPRSGEMVTNLPGVRAAMAAVSHSDADNIAIHHPGGDQGIWWAEELRGWLTTLGMSFSRVELVPGSGETDMMYLSIIRSKRDKPEE